MQENGVAARRTIKQKMVFNCIFSSPVGFFRNEIDFQRSKEEHQMWAIMHKNDKTLYENS